MNIECKVVVEQKTEKVILVFADNFKVECRKSSFDIDSGGVLQVVLLPEKNDNYFDDADCVMFGTRIEYAPCKENEICVSFGGLLGRFVLATDVESSIKNELKWYLYLIRK